MPSDTIKGIACGSRATAWDCLRLQNSLHTGVHLGFVNAWSIPFTAIKICALSMRMFVEMLKLLEPKWKSLVLRKDGTSSVYAFLRRPSAGPAADPSTH